jgi:hypothetical protein
VKSSILTLVIFISIGLLFATCTKDKKKDIDILTTTDWGKPQIIRQPSSGYITYTTGPESHKFDENGKYHFSSSLIDYDCVWNWVEKNKSMKVCTGGIAPERFVIILELTEGVLKTKEWQMNLDTTGRHWIKKYTPN